MFKFKTYWQVNKFRNHLFIKILSFLISQLVNFLSAFRRLLYEKNILKQIKVPYEVVCIGNITFGGTGKTSLVMEIASKMKKGMLIINRGYGRRKSGIKLTQKENATIEEVGDEPYLLTNILNIPIAVGANRLKVVKEASKHMKFKLVLLDDGFQHLRIKKDFNIICLDSLVPIWREKMFPYGNLRESITVLKLADLIILTKYNLIDEPQRKAWEKFLSIKFHGIPVAKFGIFPKYIVSCFDDSLVELTKFKNQIVVIFSSIGNPHAFEITCKNIGLRIHSHIPFLDHYIYTISDIHKLLSYSAPYPLLTTEKDSMKLIKFRNSAKKLFEKIYYLKVYIAPVEDGFLWKKMLDTILKDAET